MFHRLVSGLILLLMAGLRGSAGPLPPSGFLQAVPFHGAGEGFGGFSALHLSPDGTEFIALSDHGAFVTGTFDRTPDGAIAATRVNRPVFLLGGTGQRLQPGETDAEGLVVTGDGRVFVSFEGQARVLGYDTLGGTSERLRDAPAFAKMQGNRALESLALGPNGTLYVIPEVSPALDKPFPVYRFVNGRWDQPFALPRRSPFLIADATFGPDGRLYVLEREFLGLGGFATRLRRFDLRVPGLAEVTLLQTDPGTFDNLEGLAVWRDAHGLRATMVSDDNFLAFLRSQIVEFRLPD